MHVKRFDTNPLTCGSIGLNINGPSVVRVPDWVNAPLGRYYMYFASHTGSFIRLAYADRMEGPWNVYENGTLKLEESHFNGHIASPDVHVDEKNRKIVMFFHGHDIGGFDQFTRIAVSNNGIHFTARPENLTTSYWRGFHWNGRYYGINMEGHMFRSDSLYGGYKRGLNIFAPLHTRQRHMALLLRGRQLYIFFSVIGSSPEHIVCSTLDLSDDWGRWRLFGYQTVILPETVYEGADLPVVQSKEGQAPARVRQLRDPALCTENGKIFLFYSIAGENGIAGAEIFFDDIVV